MARTATSFKRGAPLSAPQPTVLIICEDSKSGKNYIEDAAHHFRVIVTVEIIHVGKTDPKGIIEEAIKRKTKYDRIFCVFDRDSHENWELALGMTRDHKQISLIISYPCFEYWLILHFNCNRKPYDRQGSKSPGDCCVADLRQITSMANYDKGGGTAVFANLIDRLPQARKNSLIVYNQAKIDGEMNPSTEFHTLIDYFEELEAELLA